MITRQLTEYREWPDGRKGCLFYIQDDSFAPKWTNDMIVLIETPARRMDAIGEHDTLHRAEWEAIMERDMEYLIMKGFGAWLIDFYLTHTNSWGVFPKKKWPEYLDRKRKDEIYSKENRVLFEMECFNWLCQKTDYLDELLKDKMPALGYATAIEGNILKTTLRVAIALPLMD